MVQREIKGEVKMKENIKNAKKTDFIIKAPQILIDMMRRALEATESGYKTWRKIHRIETNEKGASQK